MNKETFRSMNTEEQCKFLDEIYAQDIKARQYWDRCAVGIPAPHSHSRVLEYFDPRKREWIARDPMKMRCPLDTNVFWRLKPDAVYDDKIKKLKEDMLKETEEEHATWRIINLAITNSTFTHPTLSVCLASNKNVYRSLNIPLKELQ